MDADPRPGDSSSGFGLEGERWYTLHSKSGKKEKERGEIQVTVQFTRNNLTASMFDLSMKDKPRSTFSKLKDKMKGKRGEGESASAIVPSRIGALSERGVRSASEGGGEQENEEHEEGKRSKVRGFFKKPKLRKSSDSRSNTSLASGSSVSSSPGGSLSPTAGISVVVSDLSNSPSVSSNLTDSPVHTSQPSPKLLTHKRAFSDEASQVIAMPQHREVEKLKAKDNPLSQSSLCINGSHVYAVDTPAPSTLPKVTLGVLQKSSTLSRSLQNLAKKSEETPKANLDTRRWSLDKTGSKEGGKLVALLGNQDDSTQATPGHKGKPVERATQIVSTANVQPAAVKRAEEVKNEEHKKHKLHLFGGKNESKGSDAVKSGDMSPTGQHPEEKHRGWFGSKEAQNKPSPHPVKPLGSSAPLDDKRHGGSSVPISVLEKLKSTVRPVHSTLQGQHHAGGIKALTSQDHAARYYHLTHDELIALLLEREAELDKQGAELQKWEVKVHDLEEYIDRLLVHIIEETPTLLQVPQGK
ncbi:rab11 family-interacting protein 5-like isoform X3 [Polyodon spathula]|uniref:rab11 family-interacting protein 5-like isoform X3 n=1 Tax=Polyodon spathula TaxID=7913 RepID=UPI001B7D9589|nr:rab11 family-interacting protein 5-like isoform X3 [Polyodon spathula]